MDIFTQIQQLPKLYEYKKSGSRFVITYDGTQIYFFPDERICSQVATMLNAAYTEGYLKCGIMNNLQLNKKEKPKKEVHKRFPSYYIQ